MTAERLRPLSERLPPARGRLLLNAPLARYSWFRTGGPAEVLFEPADEADLAEFLSRLAPDIPVTAIGVGSNLLIRDGGVAGVVVRLGKPFATIRVEGEEIVAGAGATDIAVSRAARDAGLAGLEFLRGIPGTIGGAVRMNAGAYGREIADVLGAVRIVLRSGALRTLAACEIALSYRHSDLPADAIVTLARLRGRRGDRATISARMDAITRQREATQPVRTRTGGSTFRNPPGARAWELIDAAGCRGLRRGDAMVSEKHANFLVNTGRASAADLEALGEAVRQRVLAATGVRLEWEIERIGRKQEAGS
ncbi:MAG: UDP-N-acetylmuramate dehydrogenase [Rhodothalassiaceae bacterium]